MSRQHRTTLPVFILALWLAVGGACDSSPATSADLNGVVDLGPTSSNDATADGDDPLLPASDAAAKACVPAPADLGPPDARGAPPTAKIKAPLEIITLQTGQGFFFDGEVTCPVAPCCYSWGFGDGQTSSKKTPGTINYPKRGFFTATLMVTDAAGRTSPMATLRLAVWSGAFADNFDRQSLQWDNYGWRHPLNAQAQYEIQAGWLRTVHDLFLPGSSAILAWPVATDARIQVTTQRHRTPSEEHYADIILRMHPTKLASSFYRVRVWEEPAPLSGIELAVFKITQANDEHGILISDPSQPQSARPTECVDCAYKQDYPRDKDLRVVVEIVDNKITARVKNPSSPSTDFLVTTAVDAQPLKYDGLFGLAHFAGTTLFDEFLYNSL